ncbi:MAG: MATE family efflux transporter [Eubacterium sp.]|nr:MATE family efflux transporter [Eubacterium sp.]
MNKTNAGTVIKETAEKAQYRKMTATPVAQLIGTLAVPTMISMLVTNIYNTGDTYFVSKLGTSASGAVGIVFSLMAFYQAVGFMCGQGAGSFVSRKLGSHETEEARGYASTGFTAALFMGTVISIICLIFMNPLLRTLGSTETILPYARQYALWIFLAGPFLSASCVLNNILRYEGKAFYAMIGLTAGGLLNLAGDPVLMFGLKLGVSGAGISTAFSQIVSFGILLYLVNSGKTVSDIHFRHIHLLLLPGIFAVGFPSMIRNGLNVVTTILLNHQAKPYGDAAIAAMSIVGRVVFLIAAVAIGMGQGLQPVAAFNYGAKKYDRVRNGWKFTVISGTCILGFFAVLCIIFSEPIIEWFRDDPDVIAIGSVALRWQAVSCLAGPFAVSSNMLFQSTGKSFQAGFLALIKNGILFIPLILVLPYFFGIFGVEIAQPVSDMLTSAITVPIIGRYLKQLKEK